MPDRTASRTASPTLRYVLVAAVALVVGLVLGGLGPRAEIRSLEAEIRALESRPRRGPGEVTSLFRGRVWEDAAPAGDDPPAPAPADPPPADVAVDGDAPAPPGRAGAPPPPVVDEESAERIKDALEIRRAQALAALRERAGATDEQMDEVDRIVDRMNAELSDVAETWVSTAAAEGDLTRREMMLLAADTLDVLIETEDSLFETFDEEQRAALSDEVLDPTAYVDGSVVDRFSELEP